MWIVDITLQEPSKLFQNIIWSPLKRVDKYHGFQSIIMSWSNSPWFLYKQIMKIRINKGYTFKTHYIECFWEQTLLKILLFVKVSGNSYSKLNIDK